MKNVITLLAIFLLAGMTVFAQVGINTDNSAPDASAGLDVKFTSKGFLPPRLTSAQRNAIASPATGLVIYNTESNRLEYYAGASLGWLPNGGAVSPGMAIPDNNCTGITSAIVLSGFPVSMPTANIKVTINVTHTYLTDLLIYLIAPNGEIINLTYENCASGDNFSNTIFSDVAPNFLPFSASSSNTGYYKPTGSLVSTCSVIPNVSTFAAIGSGSINPNGTWALKIIDHFGADIGTLNEWSIDFFQTSYGTPNYVPKWFSSGTLSGTSSIYDNGNVGIGTSNPSATAALDVNSTNKGFLPPRMNTTQRNTITSPAEGLVIYNTDENTLNVYNGTMWTSLMPEPVFVCGLSLTINHLVARGVAPVNKTVLYGTVDGIPGEPAKCWITRNLGASQQATAVNDNTEASSGWYWQFNRKQGYQYIGSRIPATTWISSINETSDWITANDPCAIELGSTWRLPTYTEWYNASVAGGWTDWSGPWNSGLKLHAAGGLYGSDGSLNYRGSYGNAWSSTQDDATSGWYLFFSSSFSFMTSNNKAYGFTLRCLRD